MASEFQFHTSGVVRRWNVWFLCSRMFEVEVHRIKIFILTLRAAVECFNRSSTFNEGKLNCTAFFLAGDGDMQVASAHLNKVGRCLHLLAWNAVWPSTMNLPPSTMYNYQLLISILVFVPFSPSYPKITHVRSAGTAHGICPSSPWVNCSWEQVALLIAKSWFLTRGTTTADNLNHSFVSANF